MATITTGNHGDYKQSSRRSYIATAAFNSVLYKYTTTRSSTTFVVSGTLSAVTGATAANCPAGRILRENGRKLYPSANPGIVTYMVGVYDANSCLSGFIDPNASIFAVYNSDKPLYLTDGVDPVTGLTTDQGAPVYTRGSVAAGTGVTATTGQIRVTTPGSLTPTGTVTLDASTAQLFTYAVSNLVTTETINATNYTTVGYMVYLVVTPNTVACTITFGTGFKKTATLGTGTAGTGGRFVVTFISDGSFLCEVSRTAVQA